MTLLRIDAAAHQEAVRSEPHRAAILCNLSPTAACDLGSAQAWQNLELFRFVGDS